MNSFAKYLSTATAIVAFHASAYAGYLEDVAAGNTTTASTPAAPAPEETKPETVDTSKLLRCAKNYGSVTFEPQQLNPAMTITFSRVNLSTMYINPIFRLAAKQAGCFTLVERGTPDVRYSLKMDMVPPTVSNDVSVGRSAALGAIPLFGSLIARAEMDRAAKNLFFSESQASLMIVDAKTGEPVIGVVGVGKNTDVSLGAALLTSSPDAIAGLPSQNSSMQVVATSFVDGVNQLVPLIDKLNPALTQQKTSMNEAAK